MDIRDLLRSDHEAALATATEMCETNDSHAAKALYRKLRDALTAHSRAEEAVVYAVLKKQTADDARSIAFEGNVEHSLLDQLLAELGHGRPESDLWRAKAKVLHELLEHHVEEEHEEMFPLLATLFDTAEREQFATKFQRNKNHLLDALVYPQA